MKRAVAGLVLAVIAAAVPAGPAAAARAAIIMDVHTGAVLYQKQADRRRHPASLTKMMTLYLLFEALDEGRVSLDTKFRVSARAAGQPKSKLGLRKGDTIIVRDAILALIVKSANDVATVVAEALGGAEWRFATHMMRKARELGMRRTSFRNSSGLPNRRQLSTVRDMATLARALYRDFPHHYHYFAAQTFRWGKKTYRSHNRMIGSYAGVDGLKTGYIRASGFNLATSATRGGRRLVAVVFGARSPNKRDREMAALLDRGFAEIRSARYAPPPPPPEKPITVANAPWAIQVGAFSRVESAYAAIEKSRKHIPGIIARAAAVVVPVEEGDGGLYRARFVGVSAREARRGCRILTRKNMACEVVRHLPDTETLALNDS
ncbi:MAG: D-alanyl-D-alanine carboxypeptidase family protein [Alphaproteobacteria bacterium]